MTPRYFTVKLQRAGQTTEFSIGPQAAYYKLDPAIVNAAGNSAMSELQKWLAELIHDIQIDLTPYSYSKKVKHAQNCGSAPFGGVPMPPPPSDSIDFPVAVSNQVSGTALELLEEQPVGELMKDDIPF